MKKSLILLLAMALVGFSDQFGDDLTGNVAYAANNVVRVGEITNDYTAAADSERFKAEFAREMAEITSKIVTAPTADNEKFKVEFAYAIARVTAKIMPIVPSDQRAEFAYEMAQITTNVLNDPNLDIEKARKQLIYKIAQLTAKIIANADKATADKTMPEVNKAGFEQKAAADTGYIAPETYKSLIYELLHVGDNSDKPDNKVNIDGEIRFHYAANMGSEPFDRDSSGYRARLGLSTNINKDWRVQGMLEKKFNLMNYDNEFEARLNIAGKAGATTVTAGSFGYLMAEGNIYDSRFNGVRADFGDPVKCTLSYGETDYTQKTAIATARYDDFDYNLEAGIYRFKPSYDAYNRNTIRTIGGNYKFSNFSLGAIYLNSDRKDSNGDSDGYVFSFNYGDLKTYRQGTYDIFTKYYNQSRGTYIAHGMNGRGALLQGFKGFGLGTHYTVAENLVAGLEYYNLSDKISGKNGDTLWGDITYYF